MTFQNINYFYLESLANRGNRNTLVYRSSACKTVWARWFPTVIDFKVQFLVELPDGSFTSVQRNRLLKCNNFSLFPVFVFQQPHQIHGFRRQHIRVILFFCGLIV
ncbi:hypothetical protein SAMN05421740_10564 [Parapedobacter koreensis]|uniref:Uncharacterized protein n=1 Tax=Parapedobacter koreensis TaxID=332977 RepID=A0A1H7PYA4_9SPHI|nr:hypothetical protein SAMN05421740_10564 [Parapedobacter koreensis]